MKPQKRWMVSANGLYVTDEFWAKNEDAFEPGALGMLVELCPDRDSGERMIKPRAQRLAVEMKKFGYGDVKLVYR